MNNSSELLNKNAFDSKSLMDMPLEVKPISEIEIDAFLKLYSKKEYNISQIEGDAGRRIYYRVSFKDDPLKYILMDNSLEDSPILNYIKISLIISSTGYRSPFIFQHDLKKELLLIEDLGKTSLKQFILNIHSNTELSDDEKSESIKEIYKKTMDLAIGLQKIKGLEYLDVANYTNELLLEELKKFFTYYVPLVNNQYLTAEKQDEFNLIFSKLLENRPKFNSVFVHRDYHVENLISCRTKVIDPKNKPHIADIGVIDFQDALIGSPIYDIVSILEDARIEVDFDLAMDMLEYYVSKNSKISYNDVLNEYNILGLQRNLRICGVFAQKFIEDKDSNYLKFIPRVLNYINRSLECEHMSEIKGWLEGNLSKFELKNFDK